MSTDYLSNLDLWQASSHPLLADSLPEELFAPAFAREYKRRHHDIWKRMTRVHGTLHSLRELEGFPFAHLYGPDDMEFWRLVVANFGDMACIMLHGLLKDNQCGANTILSFKNAIMRVDWMKPDAKSLLADELKQRSFDRTSNDLAERVRLVRHTRLAHRILDPQDQFEGLGLEDLFALFDATHRQFGAISFGSAYVTLAGDLMPRHQRHSRSKTCLSSVLDAVLRDSRFVNEPERSEWWSDLRPHIDPASLAVMNQCRKRIGLPER